MRIAFVTALIAFLVGCSSIQVTTDWDPAYVPTMQEYSTWRWIKHPEGELNPEYAQDTILIGRIRTAVETYMAERGFTLVQTGTPSHFALAWHGSTEKKLSMQTVNTNYGYGYGYYGGGMGMGVSHTTVNEYDVGTLVLDVIDGSNNELVWRGTGTKTLQDYKSPEKAQEGAYTAVSKIMDPFPPSQ